MKIAVTIEKRKGDESTTKHARVAMIDDTPMTLNQSVKMGVIKDTVRLLLCELEREQQPPQS
jgi:hypothetical protein